MKRTLLISTLLGAIIGVGVCFVLPPKSHPEVQSYSTYVLPPKTLCSNRIVASDVIALTNNERSKAGLAPLVENPLLNRAAQLKASDMTTVHYWTHVSPTGVQPWDWFKQVGYHYVHAGENLAKDFDTSAGVVQGWMNSPGHRANVLKPQFTEVGTAVICGNVVGVDTELVVSEYGSR